MVSAGTSIQFLFLTVPDAAPVGFATTLVALGVGSVVDKGIVVGASVARADLVCGCNNIVATTDGSNT